MQRVEITGSSIKRVAKEGALPVQIITAEQLDKQGITSAEQLLSTISANGTGADNMTSGNNVFGADADRVSGGASYASLRGLGPNHTLVLVNGVRLANFGASAKAVDLNSIPMAAVQRVEILKDGASAIYGTDAIGGVINFILKSSYQGFEATIDDNFTQEGGGAQRRLSLLAGKGDYDKDGFNVMASLTVDHNDELDSKQRSFANGYQPSRGLSPDTTGTPYANQLTGAGTALGTSFTMPGSTNKYLQAGLLSLQGKCNTVPGMIQYDTSLWKDVTSPLRSTYSCAYDYGADYVAQMPVERTNYLLRGTIKLAPEHKMTVELLGSNTKATAILTPMQISTGLATSVTTLAGTTVINSAYPVNGPYYQNLQPYISTFDPTKPIAYKWRADPFGNRTQQNDTDNGRLLVGFEGTIDGKWDYKQNFSYSASWTHTTLTDGYALTIPLYQALGTGIINPFALPGQGQTQAAQDLINSTEYRGPLQHGKTSLAQISGSVSGEIFQLPAGPVSMAVGYDLRRETYGFQQDVDATTILLAPGNGNQATVGRNIEALYAELIIPVTKELETQLAIRTDHYSVIGNTTNPKVAFRYQPTNWLLFRGSANKGFLAPSFTQLYSGRLLEELPNGIIDPVGCPAHPGDPAYCAIDRQNYYSGGNPDLKPETSKQGTLGVVIEPVKGYSASFDWWAINTENAILNRTPQIVLANAQALSSDIVRNADGTINYINAGWINAGGVHTRGVDVSLRGEGQLPAGFRWSATLDGTWTQSYKYQEIPGEAYMEEVGNFYTRDLYLRWKHNATFNLAKGNWSGTLSQIYKSGYKDELPDAGLETPPAGFNPDVHSYTTYSLYGTYKGIKNMVITVGIQNLLNTDPPFTAHNVDEVVGAGWDPRVADPRGRSLSFQLNYKFL
jgi:iron complex outermembrane receptor protein